MPLRAEYLSTQLLSLLESTPYSEASRGFPAADALDGALEADLHPTASAAAACGALLVNRHEAYSVSSFLRNQPLETQR